MESSESSCIAAQTQQKEPEKTSDTQREDVSNRRQRLMIYAPSSLLAVWISLRLLGQNGLILAVLFVIARFHRRPTSGWKQFAKSKAYSAGVEATCSSCIALG